jgi:hypothetical protein
MKRDLFFKVIRVFSLATISLAICIAMTRFTVSREGMMPYWMDLLSTNVLHFFGVEEPIAEEDVIVVSILMTLVVYWFVASLVMFLLARLTRRIITRHGVFAVLVLCSYLVGHVVAACINDLLIKPVQFNLEPDELQFLKLSSVIILSWLGVIAVCFVLRPIIEMVRARLPHNT